MSLADDEWALWRAALGPPRDRASAEVLADLLLERDPKRGALLAKRLHGKLTLNQLFEEKAAWRDALALREMDCPEIEIDPVPIDLTIESASIDRVGPIVERVPALRITIRFPQLARAELDRVFASPAIAKIRRLAFSAMTDSWDPDEAYALERTYHAEEVLEALADCEHLRDLESLLVLGHRLDARCATALARARFSRLRELSILDNHLGDEGARILAAAPSLASLRRLSLFSCGVSPDGVRALRESMPQLEELDVTPSSG